MLVTHFVVKQKKTTKKNLKNQICVVTLVVSIHSLDALASLGLMIETDSLTHSLTDSEIGN